MRLSSVIPAHNEEGCIQSVVDELIRRLDKACIEFEIIIVNDNSTDNTGIILDKLAVADKRIKPIHRQGRSGFGLAIKEGLYNFNFDAVCITMGDGSDCPGDVIKLFNKLQDGFDVVYGSRFMRGGSTNEYPLFKLIFNRCGNYLIRILFGLGDETDITNAFKVYRRHVIEAIKPIRSEDFNITLELPLKAAFCGFNRTAVAVRWHGRKSNVSKFSIFRMCRSYLWTLMRLRIFKDLKPSRRKK